MSECDVLVRCYGEKHLLFLNYIHLIGRINMQFLALIYAGEEQDDVDLETLIAQYQAFDEQAEKAGILLGGNALEAVSTATSVRVRNSKSELTIANYSNYIFTTTSLNKLWRLRGLKIEKIVTDTIERKSKRIAKKV